MATCYLGSLYHLPLALFIFLLILVLFYLSPLNYQNNSSAFIKFPNSSNQTLHQETNNLKVVQHVSPPTIAPSISITKSTQQITGLFKNKSSGDRIEEDLERARTAIRKAILTKNYTSDGKEKSYVPSGSVYRNSYAFSPVDSFKSESLSKVREPEDDSDVLIECRDVHKSFGKKHILRGVSFKIRHGEAVGIIGPSGTGKSTVLKIIAGLLAPDKGEVYIRGRRRVGLIVDEEMYGLRIGLVFQSAALFDSLTVRENVGFLLYENSSISEDRISQLVTETLASVGLKVLLYDEPTAGLDPIASTVVEDLIRSIHVRGKDAVGKPGKIASHIVVTHQHSTIRRAFDRLIFLYEGKIVWEGMIHEFTTSTNLIVQQFASGSLDGPIKY